MAAANNVDDGIPVTVVLKDPVSPFLFLLPPFADYSVFIDRIRELCNYFCNATPSYLVVRNVEVAWTALLLQFDFSIEW